MGILAETAVYKHVKSFSYDKPLLVGYYRGKEKDKEIDIVVKYHSSSKPIMIEVKYREDSHITEKDLIVECADSKTPNLVITKKIEDYGLYDNYKDGKSIYKISAPVFLYLLGYVESIKLENKKSNS